MALRKFSGEMLAPGAARGQLAFLESDFTLLGPWPSRTGNVEHELNRFEEHIDGLAHELTETIAALEAEGARSEAQILTTHLYLIKDRKFHQDVCDEIRENGLAAEAAIESVLRRIMTVFEQSENSVIAERAADIRDIITRLNRRVGRQHRRVFEMLEGQEPVILATRELLPSTVLDARNSRVRGFVVEQGTSVSHAAILAKSLGFPILRLDDIRSLEELAGEEILVDTAEGILLIAPEASEVPYASISVPARRTIDRARLPVHLWINVADPSQVTPELLRTVAGIGLYRTEVLFMEQTDDFPSEQQQYEVYKSLFEMCRENCTVTVRTADIGGDKVLPYFPLGPQENPYLGVRANRIYREHPEILISQMRAILRAAVYTRSLRILYPMIGSREDLAFVRQLLAEAIRSLRARGNTFRDSFQQGIMIEVPSAAWSCGDLLEIVDFASVGTNDLLQYFFAVGRDDTHVSPSYRTQDPVALLLLKRLADAAAHAGKPLSICGEIASDPQLLPLLIGLGFEHLSVDIHSLPLLEEAASGLDVDKCRELAARCLRAGTARDVRTMLSDSGLVRKTRGVHPPRPGLPVDPICKESVDPTGTGLTILRKGRRIHFCSPECRDEFYAREKHAPQAVTYTT
ncbi:MAG: phosphoenolpyruvate--protein phosphotransferase [Solirubrobacterales bacterium]